MLTRNREGAKKVMRAEARRTQRRSPAAPAASIPAAVQMSCRVRGEMTLKSDLFFSAFSAPLRDQNSPFFFDNR